MSLLKHKKLKLDPLSIDAHPARDALKQLIDFGLLSYDHISSGLQIVNSEYILKIVIKCGSKDVGTTFGGLKFKSKRDKKIYAPTKRLCKCIMQKKFIGSDSSAYDYSSRPDSKLLSALCDADLLRLNDRIFISNVVNEKHDHIDLYSTKTISSVLQIENAELELILAIDKKMIVANSLKFCGPILKILNCKIQFTYDDAFKYLKNWNLESITYEKNLYKKNTHTLFDHKIEEFEETIKLIPLNTSGLKLQEQSFKLPLNIAEFILKYGSLPNISKKKLVWI